MCGCLLAGLFVAAQTTATGGKPAIPGTAQVGEELTAVVNGVGGAEGPVTGAASLDRGTVKHTDATLSGLAVVDGGGIAGALDRMFAPDTTAYTAPIWATTLTVGRTDSGYTVYFLDDPDFTYQSRKVRVEALAAGSMGVALRTDTGVATLRGLVLEWAGEVLPLNDAPTDRTFFWSRRWLSRNASSLTSPRIALPTGHSGTVCLRTSWQICPATTVTDSAAATGAPAITGTAQETFISNFGQSAAIPRSGLINAQTFDTGSRSEGYGLTRVALRFTNVVPATTLGVQIYSVTNSGEPDSPLHTLNVPTSLADGRIEFTASGSGRVRLEPNTTYAVVIADASLEDGAFASIATTESKTEEDGKLAGWNIGNRRYWRATSHDDWNRNRAILLKMEIKGLLPSAATGQPLISGVAEEGQVLSSGLGTIADVNGLPKGDRAFSIFPDDFNLQWVRVSGATETDIPGATSGTYTLTSADVGSQVKVRVTFTDAEGYEEGPLTSALLPARETIPPRNTTALVSNPEQGFWGSLASISAGHKQAQHFATGSFADGYRLDRNKTYAVVLTESDGTSFGSRVNARTNTSATGAPTVSGGHGTGRSDPDGGDGQDCRW